MSFTTNQIFKSVICLTISIFLTALVGGILMVVMPNILYQNSVNEFGFGIIFACEILSAIIASLYLGRLIKKFSIFQFSLIVVIGYIIAVLLAFFYVHYLFRIFIAVLLGSCWLSFLIIRQSWLNHVVSNKQRAIIIGLYSATISLGITSGPIVVKAFGVENYFTLVIAAAFVVLSFLVLLPIKELQPKNLNSDFISLKEFFVQNPRCFAARFLLDAQMASLLFFSVVFGKEVGFSAENAGLLISAFAISGLFDFVVGFVVFKFNPYRVINVGFAATLICFLLATVFYHSYITLALIYFIYGIFIGFIFVAVATTVNNQYEKKKLLATNATFQIIGSIGTLFGVILCGILMQIFGFYGFFVTIILINLIYFFVLTKKKFQVQNDLTA